jgi:hypothetical protein
MLLVFTIVRPNLAEDDLFDWCSKVKLLSHGNISFIIIWVIWGAQNDFIFNSIRTRVHESVTKIQSILSQCFADFDSRGLASSRSATEHLVAWSHPYEGTMLMSVF